MTGSKVVLTGLSAAMDGGFTAIADVSTAMVSAGAAGDYRLIGGVTVMLHIERLGLDLPLRATGDADFGVPPHVLRRPDLVQAIEALGYKKVFGRSSTTSTGVPIVRSSTTTFTTSSSVSISTQMSAWYLRYSLTSDSSRRVRAIVARARAGVQPDGEASWMRWAMGVNSRMNWLWSW
jgi:hypothetical protein